MPHRQVKRGNNSGPRLTNAFIRSQFFGAGDGASKRKQQMRGNSASTPRPADIGHSRLAAPHLLTETGARDVAGQISSTFSAGGSATDREIFSSVKPSTLYFTTKRAFDIVFASLVGFLLLPLIGLVAIAIYVEDPGPVFYVQPRTGRNRTPFPFYKFRSMVCNADAIKANLAASNEAGGPIFKMRDDPRVTKVGRILRRFSIDEIPQLLNVIRGEMSIIGPRPLPVREAAQLTERQQARHDVPPGLLCFREIMGRSRLGFERWMELDLLYIDQRSAMTDIKILLSAIPAILSADGAY